jgi:hypothetical protein
MAYNEKLDARVRAEVAGSGTTRKKMFGGTAHTLNGNLLCGVHKNCLILRLGEQATIEALKEAHVMPFDFTGRPMKGWVMVEKQVLGGKKLSTWLIRARKFVSTLPSK